MVAPYSQLDEINVLASQSDWAWPVALRQLFQPRGINLLVTSDTNELVNILANRRIHTAIIDGDTAGVALAMVRLIRMEYPLVPCILLSRSTQIELLDKALELDVYSVLDKPVNLEIMKQLLNKLFIRKYNSNIFGD